MAVHNLSLCIAFNICYILSLFLAEIIYKYVYINLYDVNPCHFIPQLNMLYADLYAMFIVYLITSQLAL